MRLIRAALSIGFTIDELKEILAMRDRGGLPCTRVRDLAAAKLRRLENHILELNELHDQLKRAVEHWNVLLRKASPPLKPAGLLDSLAASHSAGRSLPPELYTALGEGTSRKGKRK